MKNLWLIGLSGSGKSTLGRLAAKALDRQFIDTDAQIEMKSGKSVSAIFAEYGEEAFRAIESDALGEAAACTGCVIATGGGAVLDPANRARMRENGFVVFLDRPAEQILKTLDSGSRPLLAENKEKLYIQAGERRKFYTETAHACLALTSGPEESLETLLAAFRAETITSGYALIGDPVIHSISPAIHEAVFRAIGRNDTYSTLHVPRGTLPRFLDHVRAVGLPGFNVTIPHKRDILPLLDDAGAAARLCGSVNIVVNRAGKLCGFNTDMEGLLLSLRDKGRGFQGERIAILGTGGAAIPTAFIAAKEGAAALRIFGRSEAAARQAAEKTHAAYQNVPVYAGEFQHKRPFMDLGGITMLINATPLGMHGFGEDFGDFRFLNMLSPDTLVCDLVFNPSETALLKAAAERGLPTLGGVGMLIYQALLTDELFTGQKLDKKALYQSVRKTLGM